MRVLRILQFTPFHLLQRSYREGQNWGEVVQQKLLCQISKKFLVMYTYSVGANILEVSVIKGVYTISVTIIVAPKSLSNSCLLRLHNMSSREAEHTSSMFALRI